MSITAPFTDRRAAGRALAAILVRRELASPVVLALPRGGVAVAAEIARALAAPLDIVLVRKIGVPYQPELAAAAVVDGDKPEVVVNADVIALADVPAEYIEAATRRELAEIERRRALYLEGRARVPIEGRTAILVDDGIATGTSVRAAIEALRRHKPKALVLAVPVAPREVAADLARQVDDLVCLATPDPFFAIGVHYLDFHQLSDAEVVELLAEVPAGPRGGAPGEEAGPGP